VALAGERTSMLGSKWERKWEENVVRKIIIVLLAVMTLNVFAGDYANGEALSMQVTNGNVGELIRFAAREGSINVIMDSGAGGQVSVNLQEVSPREAIEQLVLASGLCLSERDGTLIIGRGPNIAAQLGQVHVLPVAYGDLEELRHEVELYFQNRLINDKASAKTMKKDTSGDNKSKKQSKETKSLVTANGNKTQANRREPRVEVDVNTRSLLVYGTEEEAQAIRGLIRRLDVPGQQVALEAKVVAVKREDLEKLGVTWEWTKIPHDFTYNATLDMLIANGKAKVLSRPNIVTLQGREAVINIGGEVPVPEVSITNTTTTTSIKYRPAGIILQCRPFVNDAGYIDSQLNIEVSAPSYVKEMNAYSFQKRSAQTRVRMKDGETLIIGGLINREEIKQMQKIPFLGDIPVLGNFFRSTSTKAIEEEITIFITAHILSDGNNIGDIPET